MNTLKRIDKVRIFFKNRDPKINDLIFKNINNDINSSLGNGFLMKDYDGLVSVLFAFSWVLSLEGNAYWADLYHSYRIGAKDDNV